VTATAPSTRDAALRRLPADGWWAAMAVAVLGLAAWAAWDQQVPGWERDVFAAVNTRSVLPYAVVWPVMQLGNLLVVPASALAATLTHRPRLGLALLVGGVGAYVLAKVIKATAERPRPAQLLEEVTVRGPHTTDYGFVSGHAAVVMVVVCLLLPQVGPHLRGALLSLAVLVAGIRVYIGAHLPLDVVGGAALGVAVAALVRLAVEGPTTRGGQRGRRHASGRPRAATAASAPPR
jgi:membrane-associated phospholipid phosphatase